MSDGGSPGRLLIIGGAEDRCCGAGLLERFAELCGGEKARIVLVTAATNAPEEVVAEYERVFRKLGVDRTSELRLRGRADADSDDADDLLATATGVFFSGGDQSRLRTLVGSRTNKTLARRLRDGLVVGGTSAGATAMGRTMILGGAGPDVSAAAVRTGPGLGLVPHALIDMHFGERGRLPRLLSAVALDPEHLGIGLDENTGVLVDGDGFEVIGSRCHDRRRRRAMPRSCTRPGSATRSPCSACGCTCCPPAACSTSERERRPSGPRTTGTENTAGGHLAVMSPAPRPPASPGPAADQITLTAKEAAVRFTDLRHLNGPNVFTSSPVVIARLELDEQTRRETTDAAGSPTG